MECTTRCVHDLVAWLTTQPFHIALFAVLGAVLVASTLCGLVCFIWRHIRPGISFSRFGLKDGAYAVVTGATDGIGKEFAKQLGAMGFNVIIIGRRPDALEATAKEITEGAKKRGKTVEVKSVQADLSLGVDVALKQKLDALNVNVGVLVNNVGQSYEMPTPFAELEPERVKSLIALNVTAAAEMSHWALPKMVARRGGLILNISSGSAVVPAPLLALYSATKAFLDTFSIALAHEYKSKGIHVEVISPFHITTKLSKIRYASMSVPTPANFVRTTLKKIGRSNASNPWLMHDIMGSALRLLPRSMAINRVHGELAHTRRRALAKRAQAQDESKKGQ